MSLPFDFFDLLGVPNSHDVIHGISKDLPTKEELSQTKTLMDCFNSFGVIPDTLDHQHREKIIDNLESLFREWLVEMCESMNVPEIVRDTVGGKVVAFGSFHLGVDSKESDMDLLCVGPVFLKRKDFFTSFLEKLKAQKEVKDIRAIEGAFVPIIKMTYDGIEIDLLFACLNQRSIPKKVDLLDDQMLKDMNKKCVVSLNGYRVTEEILRWVPNVDNFRQALRVIKLWAKRRNIYSNKLGFLGGVSWAILVARICQLHPSATASTLVNKCFAVWSEWGTRAEPVLLRTVENWSFEGFCFWDSKTNRSDRRHLLPIITPAYPQQNSSVNVTRSTFDIIKEECKRGHAITEGILQRKAYWSKLFQRADFLGEYRHFILLTADSPTETSHLQWTGLVESKIRLLMMELQKHEYISRVHVYPQAFSSTIKANGSGRMSTTWLVGLGFNIPGRKPIEIDLNFQLLNFTDAMYVLAEVSEILEEGMSLSASYTGRENVTLKMRRNRHTGVFTPKLKATVTTQLQFYVNPCQTPAVSAGQPAMKRKGCSDSEAPAKRTKTDTESVNNQSSGQASPPITPCMAPQAPKCLPCLVTSSKKPRLTEEPGPGTKDPSCDKSSTEALQTTSQPLTGSSPTTSRPVDDGVPNVNFEDDQSLTVDLCDEPPGPAKPFPVVKRAIKFQLLREDSISDVACLIDEPEDLSVAFIKAESRPP